MTINVEKKGIVKSLYIWNKLIMLFSTGFSLGIISSVLIESVIFFKKTSMNIIIVEFFAVMFVGMLILIFLY